MFGRRRRTPNRRGFPKEKLDVFYSEPVSNPCSQLSRIWDTRPRTPRFGNRLAEIGLSALAYVIWVEDAVLVKSRDMSLKVNGHKSDQLENRNQACG